MHGKNTVVMSAGPAKNGRFPAILDRSPCGSGTAAVMANLWQKGKLQIGTIYSKFHSNLQNWQMYSFQIWTPTSKAQKM